jgi:hypothetical protein
MPKEENKAKADNASPSLSHDQVRHAILAILYKKREEMPNDYAVGRVTLVDSLKISENQIDFNMGYLADEGLAKCRTVPNSPFQNARITSDGMKAIEHKQENKKRFPFLTAKIQFQFQGIVINL